MQLLSTLQVLSLLTPPQGLEYISLIPGAIVTLVALTFIIIDVFHRKGTSRDYQAYFSVVGLTVAAASCFFLWDSGLDKPTFFGMLYFDRFSIFFSGLACVSGALAVLSSPAVLRTHQMSRGEYYLLILFSVIGMIFMSGAADLLSIFIAFEVMSIPLYVLAAFLRKDERSAEAGMKYFVLGAFSATLMLYGIALVYGATGTTNLQFIGENLTYLEVGGVEHSGYGMVMLGLLLIFGGFIFKVSGVPFHVWAPDVYTGSPTPAVSFMASAAKALGFAAMIRIFVVAFPLDVLRGGFFGWGWIDVAFFVSMASMILGNLAAVVQDNVKRMLAYSGIAHAGYLMLGFAAANSHPSFYLHNDAILFSLVVYMFGLTGAFGVLSYFGRSGEEVSRFSDLGNLGLRYPKMGLVMSVSVLSMAGIPPTAGFLAKFYIFRTGVDVAVQTGETSFVMLAVVGVLSSVAGTYYYLKVMVYLYMKPAEREIRPLFNTGTKWATALCAIMIIYLGFFPGKILEMAREAVMDMQGVPPAVQATIDRGEIEIERQLSVWEEE